MTFSVFQCLTNLRLLDFNSVQILMSILSIYGCLFSFCHIKTNDIPNAFFIFFFYPLFLSAADVGAQCSDETALCWWSSCGMCNHCCFWSVLFPMTLKWARGSPVWFSNGSQAPKFLQTHSHYGQRHINTRSWTYFCFLLQSKSRSTLSPVSRNTSVVLQYGCVSSCVDSCSLSS